MERKKLIDVMGTIILLVGMLIAFSSHAFHARIGLGQETSHLKHVVYGIITALIGLGILIWNNDALIKTNKNGFKP